MAKKPDLIIVDTNLWVSFLLKRSFAKLDKVIISGRARLIFSEELLAEFIEVSRRPKFKKYFTTKDISDILDTINEYALFFDVIEVEEICRDPKDDFLLALAKISNSDYLLTGDQDLLVLKRIGKTRIITMTEYLTKQ